ncbi:hypothetical protein ABIE27_005090 [Paenibacillus sp. 4624]|uniref:hypothetical protein n=1 Tax=Paenibacillus sp. 4624 TaxID=3156453 RepID=UPI003D21F0C4
MKKTVVLLLSLILLAGCNQSTNKDNTDTTSSSTKQETSTEAVTTNLAETPSESSEDDRPAFGMLKEDQGKLPPVVDGVLTVPGQTTKFDYGGEMELLKIADGGQYWLGPLAVQVNDIKLFKVTGLPEEAQNKISRISGKKVGDEFQYVQISYVVGNTSKDNIQFFGLETVVLGKSEQIMTTRNIFKDSFDSDVFYGESQQSGLATLVFDKDASLINEIKLIFSSVWKADDLSQIESSGEVTIKFE